MNPVTSIFRRPFAAVSVAMVFGLACVAARSARAQVPREFKLKAVFLFNFAQFTEWPANAFDSTNAPFVIGVLGANPFDAVLDDVVRGETVHGHRLRVERYQRVEDIRTCHILYISQSEAPRLEEIVNYLRGKPILTVSDIDSAAYSGVIIRFLTNHTIHFRVNLDAAKAAGVTLSSQLLRSAEIVGEKKQ